MPLTGPPAEITPDLKGRFTSAAPRRVQSFLYRLAATAGSLGTERETYYSSSLLFEVKFKRYLAVAVKTFSTNVKIWSKQPPSISGGATRTTRK